MARPELAGFIARVLAGSLDIRSLWSLDHSPEAPDLATPPSHLLAFANLATLQSLRKATDLHREDLTFLVVIDGDRFESAWGACKISGSLARWAWRHVSTEEAYYDEARWDSRAGHAGGVVRLRRKAQCIWESELARSTARP